MRIVKTIFVATAFISPAYFCAAQTAPNAAPAASSTAPAGPDFTPTAPSAILQRSLDEVLQTVTSVRLEKWKRGSVREEAGTNIDAIQRAMQRTLPSLLKDADAAPGTLSKVLPLSRNVDALYDVLLHIVEASRVVGTGEDAGQLQQAMADLEKARIALDNQIQQTAAVEEKQIVALRTTVQKQEVSLRAAATPPPAPKCPTAPPTPAKKRTTKPSTSTNPSTTAKPAAGSSTTTAPAKPQ